jgi:hypothetical protein
MDRERAEAHLRMLAEDEMRHAILPDRWGIRVSRVAQALTAVGALDDETAKRILDEVELARALRHPDPTFRRHLSRAGAASLMPHPAPRRRAAAGRVVPIGQLVPVHAEDVSGEICLLSYAQQVSRGLLTMIARPYRSGERGPDDAYSFSDFAAVDDQGNRYEVGLHGSGVSGPGEWILRLHPDPPSGLRWLDLSTGAGEPATRVDLSGPAQPADAPEATVSTGGPGPGEHLLNSIAMRLLAATAAYPRQIPLYLAGLAVSQAVDGLGDIVAALQICGAVAPSSPVPAQLAALCQQLELSGHGITTTPADRLPERWQNVIVQFMRGPRARGAARSAVVAGALPEVEGIGLTVLGLHDSGDRTVVFMHVSGTTGDASFELNTWPVIWIRDSGGWWHATRAGGSADEDREITMDMPVIPPLSRDTEWIEVIASGRSAQARVVLPVRWQVSRPAT